MELMSAILLSGGVSATLYTDMRATMGFMVVEVPTCFMGEMVMIGYTAIMRV